MAGGRHHWQHQVLLGGVDVTARCRGELWHRQERSAAHLARVRLALATADPDAEADAATGLALVITMAWDAGTARPWFSGRVQIADYDDAEGVLILEASDQLQEWAEAQSEAAIDAAVSGSRRVAEVQAARQDGWSQMAECLKTVRASYAIGRDGVHRLIPWATGTPAATWGAGQVRHRGVARVRRALRERVNRVVYRLSVRGVRLSIWHIAGGWGAAQTYCQWYADQWVRPPVATIREAILAAGPVYQRAGVLSAAAGAGGGIGFTLPPQTPWPATMNCTGTPQPYWQDPTVCLGATWEWELRSRQLFDLAYELRVDCEASQAAWGILADERDATVDLTSAYQGWETGTAGPPVLEAWDLCPGDGAHGVSIPRAVEVAAIESALAEADVTIAASHLQALVVQTLPWQVQDVDLHQTVSYTGGTAPWIGRPAAIEGRLDLDSWEAATTITLARLIPLSEGSADALVAPERPVIPATYDMESTYSWPLRLGGRTEALAYDGTWEGVTTNYLTTDAAAPVYPYRARFVRPAVPDGARASITVQYAPTWRVRLGA